MLKEARHAHSRMRERTGLSPGLVRVMERKFKDIKPGAEYFSPLRRGRDTVGYAVFGVYGGKPTMKTVLGPHMRPKGTALEDFQVKTGDMMKYAMFELGVQAGLEKTAGFTAAQIGGTALGGAIGAGAGAAAGKKKNRRRNALLGALLGASGGAALGTAAKRMARAPKHDIAKGRSTLDKGWEDLRMDRDFNKARSEAFKSWSKRHPGRQLSDSDHYALDLIAKEKAREAKRMIDHKASMKSFEDFMKSDRPLEL